MLVDEARYPGESNALTQIPIELSVTDNCYGDPGHVAGGEEVAHQGDVNAHDTKGASQFPLQRLAEPRGFHYIRYIGVKFSHGRYPLRGLRNTPQHWTKPLRWRPWSGLVPCSET